MRRSLDTVEVNIGKNGVNEGVFDEITRQLKDHEVIKVRFTRTVKDYKDEFLEEIVANTKSKLIDVRGNVAVLYKRK